VKVEKRWRIKCEDEEDVGKFLVLGWEPFFVERFTGSEVFREVVVIWLKKYTTEDEFNYGDERTI